MDNYSNQGQQYSPYQDGQQMYNQQYNPYQGGQQMYNQQQYNPYGGGQQMYNQPQNNPYGSGQNYYSALVVNQQQIAQTKKSFITLSMILGLVGSVIMLIGLMMPMIDFSHFHHEVDIQYNLFKVGKNVGIISGMWNVIPYAILISIIGMIILSFVRIPILKILPSLLIVCMLVLMLVDMGNVVTWATDLLDKVGIVLEKEITTREIFKSLMPGIYIMVAGLVVSMVSCFVKIRDN